MARLPSRPEDPDGGGQQQEQLEDGARPCRGPSGPVEDGREGAQDHEDEEDAAQHSGAGVENFGKEAECREDVESRQNSVEEIEDGSGREGVDLLGDVEGAVGGLGEQHDGEPEVLALGMADEKQAEDGEADEAGGDGVGVGVDEADVACDLLVGFFDGHEGLIAGQVSPVEGSPADVTGPDGGMPDPNGDVNGTAVGASRRGEWKDLVADAGVGRDGGRHLAGPAGELALHEDLKRGDDGREHEGGGLGAGGNVDGEAVPAIAAHVRVALHGPGAVACEEWPGGVVEGGLGPEEFLCSVLSGGVKRRVAGMEAPLSVERDHRLAISCKIEGLRRQGGHAGQGERGKRSQSSKSGTRAHRQVPRGEDEQSVV